MHAKLTRSRNRKWSRNSIDHESSDAVKLKQLRDHMVLTHLESPRSSSEVLAAYFESGTWIIHDSKLLILKSLEVGNDTSNAMHILGNLVPRQPADPDASMERNTLVDQNKGVVAQLITTIDTDHVKSKNRDKEGGPDDQRPLILLNRTELRLRRTHRMHR